PPHPELAESFRAPPRVRVERAVLSSARCDICRSRASIRDRNLYAPLSAQGYGCRRCQTDGGAWQPGRPLELVSDLSGNCDRRGRCSRRLHAAEAPLYGHLLECVVPIEGAEPFPRASSRQLPARRAQRGSSSHAAWSADRHWIAGVSAIALLLLSATSTIAAHLSRRRLALCNLALAWKLAARPVSPAEKPSAGKAFTWMDATWIRPAKGRCSCGGRKWRA